MRYGFSVVFDIDRGEMRFVDGRQRAQIVLQCAMARRRFVFFSLLDETQKAEQWFAFNFRAHEIRTTL